MVIISRQRPAGSHPVYYSSFRDLPPSEWPVKRVNEMALTFKGKLPSKIIDEPNERTKTYLLMEGLRGGIQVFTEETHLPSITENDTAVIADGSNSGFAIHGVNGVLGSTLLGFRIRDGMHPDYLFHLLSSLFPYLNSTTTGTAIPHLDQDLLLRLPLGIPRHYDEQNSIATILNVVDNNQKQTKSAIEKVKALRDSLIHYLLQNGIYKEQNKKSIAGLIPVTWNCEPLGQLIEDGPTNGMYLPESEYVRSGTRIVRIDSIADGKLTNINSLRRVKVTPIIERRFELTKDDILINRVNALSHIGKSAIIPQLDEPTIFESNMIRLRCGPRILPEYLILVLCSDIARRHWLARSKPAVNQVSINQRDVCDLQVPITEIDEQREIAHLVFAVTSYIEKLVAIDSAQKTLKKSLMHDLLTGRVRVKNIKVAAPT